MVMILVLFNKIKHANELINELLQSSTAVPLAVLEDRLGVSRRSIFYTIKRTNKVLSEHNIDEIINIHGVGYRLSAESKQLLTKSVLHNHAANSFTDFFKNHLDFPVLNQRDRIPLIEFCLISREATSLVEFCQFFNISKNTVIKDLNKIRNSLPNDLFLKNTPSGKLIIGNELTIRRWVFANFSELMNLIDPYIDVPINNNFNKQLKLLERITGNAFTDDSSTLLTSFLYWLMERIKNNPKTILPMDENKDQYSLTYTWAKSFLNDIGIHNNSEAIFLAEIVNTQAFQHINKRNPMIVTLRPIATKIIQLFNEMAGINLPINDNTLSKKLTIHLIPTYYRVKYHIQYHNPLVDQIEYSYKKTFNITKLSIKPFTDFVHQSLSDDEISLITVYFSGALRNLNIPTHNKDSAMVICSSGIGTSELLITQLRSHYPSINFIGPLNTFEFENVPFKNIKLILSTIELPTPPEGVPIMTVPVIPSTSDWQQIDSSLRNAHLTNDSQNTRISASSIMDIVSNYARIEDPKGLEHDLKKFLNTAYNAAPQESAIQNVTYYANVYHNKFNWEQATKLAMEPLVYEGIITPNYIQSIFNLTKEHGDYMAIGKGVFLAHAAPTAGVKRLGFSFTYFKEPFKITGSDKNINFIVGLAPVDQKRHLQLLTNLLQFVQNEKLMQKLNTVNTREEFEKLLSDGHLIS